VACDGNLLGEEKISLDLAGKTSAQVKAALGDAVKQIVDQARERGVPIAVEKLDFSEQKKRLREQSKAYARMLSSFAYALFFSLLLRRAARRGVEVKCVNPAYTSVIG
jgi:transposase, IS605 OrfB family, central region